MCKNDRGADIRISCGVDTCFIPCLFLFTAHPCAGFDCQHDGHCDLDENYSPYCVCTYKYEGVFCQNGMLLLKYDVIKIYE